MKSKVAILATVGMLTVSLLSPIAEAVSSVSGIRFLNNEEDDISFKVDVDGLGNSFNVKSDIKEVFGDGSARTSGSFLDDSGSDHPQSLYWVIRHLSAERDISVSNGKVIIGDIPTSQYESGSYFPMQRSDFMMYLSQLVFGVKESRAISFKSPSIRVAGEQYTYIEEVVNEDGSISEVQRIAYREPPSSQNVSDGDPYRVTLQGDSSPGIYTFSEGDYWYYYSPNVKELYLTDLISRGIISSSDISDISLLNSFKTDLIIPWGSKVPAFPMGYADRNGLQSMKFMSGSPLGRSFEIEGISDEDKTGPPDFSIKHVPKSYLVDESLKVIDAYRLIEKFLRASEKDMTVTESKIISYKYGMNYFDVLTEDDRNTLMFLTAKGVLDFEDPSEFKNLYVDLKINDSYDLLYRTGNKDARLDFSQIQITDFDNFWINRGYSQMDMKLYSTNDVAPEVTTLEVVEVTTTARNNGNYKASALASGSGVYSVTKVYNDGSKFLFMEKKVSELVVDDSYVETIEKNGSVVTVVYKVPATSPMNALQLIDSNTVVDSAAYNYSSDLSGVSKIDLDGKTVTLVPKSSLKLLSFNGTQIEVLEDKVLRNSSTGVTAVLLPDNDTALIGAHVINSKDLMVTPVGGEIYYNLDIIKTLLPNMYINKLDNNSVYFTSGMKNEKVTSVFSDNTGNQIGKTYMAEFTTFPEELTDIVGPSNTFKSYKFINLSHMGNLSNTIIKDFVTLDSFGEEVKFKLIMYFEFNLPDEDMGFTDPIYDAKDPSFKDVHKFIYNPPTDQALLDVWENNKEISNGLLNTVYGTSGLDYVKTGWISPSIHVVYDNTHANQITLLKDFFIEAGENISSSWYEKFLGVPKVTGNSVVAQPYDPSNAGSKFYPNKELTVNMFPMWVHAMFNNGASWTGVQSNYVGSFTNNTPTNLNNTTLWRYMMSSRVLLYDSVSISGGGFKSYKIGDYEYLLTDSGNVFMKLSSTNDKFTVSNEYVTYNGRPQKEDVLWVKTRTEDTSLKDKVGKIVSFREADSYFYVNTVFGDKIKLTDMSRLEGTPSMDADGNFVLNGRINNYHNNSRTSIIQSVHTNRMRTLELLFDNPSYKGYEDVFSDLGKGGTTFGDVGNYTQYPIATLSASLGRILDVSPIAKDSTGTTFNYKEMKNKSMNAYISFLIPRSLFTITDNNELHARKTYPFLTMSNVYHGTITKNIIDSIIFNYNGTVKVKDLSEGSKVRIGDIMFTKYGNTLVSDPVRADSTARTVLNDPSSSTKLTSWAGSKFAGLNINVSNTVDVPFTDYINNVTLSTVNNVTTVTGTTLVSSATGPALSKTTSKGTEVVNINKVASGVDYISFSLDVSGDIMVRNTYDSITYELLLYTSSFMEGSVSNLPFFNEDLSLGSQSFDMLTGNKESNAIVGTAVDLKSNFNSFFDDLFKSGIYSVLIFILFVTVLVITGSVVLGFTLGYFDVSRNLLLDWRSRPDGSHGVDLIKIVTFGQRNLDNPVTVPMLFIMIFALGLLYLALYVSIYV